MARGGRPCLFSACRRRSGSCVLPVSCDKDLSFLPTAGSLPVSPPLPPGLGDPETNLPRFGFRHRDAIRCKSSHCHGYLRRISADFPAQSEAGDRLRTLSQLGRAGWELLLVPQCDLQQRGHPVVDSRDLDGNHSPASPLSPPPVPGVPEKSILPPLWFPRSEDSGERYPVESPANAQALRPALPTAGGGSIGRLSPSPASVTLGLALASPSDPDLEPIRKPGFSWPSPPILEGLPGRLVSTRRPISALRRFHSGRQPPDALLPALHAPPCQLGISALGQVVRPLGATRVTGVVVPTAKAWM